MRRTMHPTDALVAAQFVTAAGLLWPGRARWPLPRGVRGAAGAAMLGGAALSGAGVRELGSDLTPFVDPRRGAALRTGGAFGLSRNPVYAGLLLAATGFAVLRRRPEPVLAATALTMVLQVKMGVEETRLRARFGDEYAAYAARTPRLLGLPARRRLGGSGTPGVSDPG
jgi:protein-S-isoprenylcysteine O-methyltransferase Ste14